MPPFGKTFHSDKSSIDIGAKLNEAVKFHQSGQLKKAREIYKKILAIDPDNSDALHLLGFVAHQSGDNVTAFDLINEAIRIHPEYPFYHNSLGLVLKDLGKLNEAVSCYQKALELKPDYPEVLNNMGVALQDQDKLEEATSFFRKALDFNPHAAETHNNMGNVLKNRGKLNEAIIYYQKALKLKPEFPEAFNNIGVIYQNQYKFSQAISCYRKALVFRPDYTEAYINMGIAFQYMCELDNAMSCYQKALNQEPENTDAHFHYAFSLLLSGNLEKGWKEYEWRLLKKEWKKTHTYNHNIPRWAGSSFKGKTLFVHSEQGLGDTLQFVRYLPLVKAMGGKIIFETGEPLLNIFQGFPGVDKLVSLSSTENSARDYDLFTPLMSIPYLISTSIETIPSQVPYLYADPVKSEAWRKKLPKGGFKVGLVWAGKPTANDNRPCKLKYFSPLAGVSGIQLFGLQKGDASDQVQGLPDEMSVTNLGEYFHDFADTAGAVENLDLIISIDTSVAHLAGAMGKPVWTLLPFAPDWRWLLDRDDSPWYPTMRLFRQPEPGNWDAVFKKVVWELGRRV